MTVYGMFHPGDVDRLYPPREIGGRRKRSCFLHQQKHGANVSSSKGRANDNH